MIKSEASSSKSRKAFPKLELPDYSRLYPGISKLLPGEEEKVNLYVFPEPKTNNQKQYNQLLEGINSHHLNEGKIQVMKEAVELLAYLNQTKEIDKIIFPAASSNLLFHIAMTYLNLRQTKEAHKFFLESVNANPLNGYAHVLLGYLAGQADNQQEAIYHYRLGIALCPKYIVPYINLGSILHKNGDYQKAIDCYNSAILLDAGYGPAYVNRANTYMFLNQLEKAEKDLSKAMELLDDPLLKYNRAMLYFFRGKLKETKEQLLEIKDVKEHCLYCYINLASIAMQEENYEEAKGYCEKAFSLDPCSDPAIINKLVVHLLLGEFLDAVKMIYTSLHNRERLNENIQAYLYHMLGNIMARSGYYEQAEKCYKKELKLLSKENKAQTAQAYISLGHVLFDLQKFTDAQEAYKKAQAEGTIDESETKSLIAECYEHIADPSRKMLFRSGRLFDQTAKNGFSGIENIIPIQITDNMEMSITGKMLLTDTIGSEYRQSVKKYDLELRKEQNNRWCVKSQHPDAKTWRLAKGTVNFVALNSRENDQLVCSASNKGMIGHFYLAGGSEHKAARPVRYAGEIHFSEDGIIEYWNNDSGHFKPPYSIALEIARTTGLPIDKFRPMYIPQEELPKLFELIEEARPLSTFNPALIFAPGQKEYIVQLNKNGCRHSKDEHFEAAIACFKRALAIAESLYQELDSKIAKINFNIGSCYMKLGSYEDALPYLNKAYEILSILPDEGLKENTVKCKQRLEECQSKIAELGAQSTKTC